MSIGQDRSTLVNLLRWRAELQPNQLAYTFQHDEGEEELTYGELDRRARGLGVTLREFKPGARALLLFQPGLPYLISFFGCLYAGLVPVPAYPPRSNGHLGRLQAIVTDSQAELALTTASIFTGMESRFSETPELQGLAWRICDQVEGDLADEWEVPQIEASSLAFLQYTSGSTSLPKGVMLSHSNLLHNLQLIEDCFGTNPESQCVIWLPPYHDMGLIGGILQPLYTGYPVTLMAPVDFIQRPYRWLETISRIGGTVSGGPNFAYDLCVQKITPEQRATLDLSKWEIAFTGAEPIRAETLERFAEMFAPCGFRREAFYPCYGLAEGTLFVTGGRKDEAPIVRAFAADQLTDGLAQGVEPELDGANLLVSSGRLSLVQQQVQIVNPQTRVPCPPGQVGEIWVAGGSVAQGYWNRTEQTKETFHAQLADGATRYLRTGDLGFASEGELFVTGRMKDVILIRGRNYYPQDIEFTVQESHVAVNNGNGAAFSVEVDGEERLVVVQEVERQHRRADLTQVTACIREGVAREHRLQVYAVVLIKPVSISKTSSGKVQRHKCKERFVDGTLDVLHMESLDVNLQGGGVEVAAAHDLDLEVPSREEWLLLGETQRLQRVEQLLQVRVARVLKVPEAQVSGASSLDALGLDSLMAVQIKHELEEAFGVDLPLEHLLSGVRLVDVAEKVAQLWGEVRAEEGAFIEADGAAFPLTAGQHGLWLIQQMDKEAAAYNVSRAARLESDVDVEALRAAFAGVVQLHPMLRTRVVYEGDQLKQRVFDDLEADFATVEAGVCTDPQWKALWQEEAYRPFDLEREAPVRLRLFRRGDGESVLVLAAHHIVVDFWSMGLLMRDLQELYEQACRNQLSVRDTVGHGYREHVRRQSRMLDGEAGRAHQAYWLAKLGGELSVLELPTDRPRPRVQTYRGAELPFLLPAALSADVKRVAQECGVTMHMFLLAAYQVLLHRYTGQQDLTVGSPTVGRARAQDAQVVGYYVNPVVQRADFSTAPTFAELLQQVRTTVIEALEHQEYPFPLLVEALQPQRDASVPPLFQAMFHLQRAIGHEAEGFSGFALGESGAQMQIGGLRLQSLELEPRYAQYDLSLTMGEWEAGLSGRLQYNQDLFEPQTIARMAGHFRTLLESIVADCGQRVAELPMLTDDERQLMLVEWNQQDLEYDPSLTFVERVERVASSTPDALAVVCGEHRLTYAELNAQSNQLAQVLRRNGIGPNSTVGVYLERRAELLLSWLAVWKAGGTFVPVDPLYPVERMAYMLQDAQVGAVLTMQSLVQRVESVTDAPVLCVEELDLSQELAENSGFRPAGNDLAYIIYTSGSTGQPKGVQVEHRSLQNAISWHHTYFNLSAADRSAQLLGPAFDATMLEVWPFLSVGACIQIPDDATRMNPEVLAKWVNSEGITVVNTTTVVGESLLVQEWPAETSLRLLMVGGERLMRRPHSGLPFRMHNMYGPTEATIMVTSAVVEPTGDAPPVLGRGVAKAELYLLNDHKQPVPIGVTGELHIGGLCLARGYLNREDLTQKAFIPNPITEGTRLYATGDLMRWNADGALEFVGRADHQVKVRGFRIEMGEIKKALEQHPQIDQAIVQVHVLEEQKHLTAYVLVKSGEELDRIELRRFLKQLLPDYMIPSFFLLLDAFPLTSNGKIDLRSLPIPDPSTLLAGYEYVAPRSPVEEMVAEICAEVLGIERIGVLDNFFERGGHSLLAAQVVARVKDLLQLDLSYRELFEASTIADLAQVIEDKLFADILDSEV